MSDHQPHIIPTRRDVEMAELEQEIGRLRAELSSNTGQLDTCRRLLREVAETFDEISRRGGFSTTLGWGDVIELRDRAARAAGGSDES